MRPRVAELRCCLHAWVHVIVAHATVLSTLAVNDHRHGGRWFGSKVQLGRRQCEGPREKNPTGSRTLTVDGLVCVIVRKNGQQVYRFLKTCRDDPTLIKGDRRVLCRILCGETGRQQLPMNDPQMMDADLLL